MLHKYIGNVDQNQGYSKNFQCLIGGYRLASIMTNNKDGKSWYLL